MCRGSINFLRLSTSTSSGVLAIVLLYLPAIGHGTYQGNASGPCGLMAAQEWLRSTPHNVPLRPPELLICLSLTWRHCLRRPPLARRIG